MPNYEEMIEDISRLVDRGMNFYNAWNKVAKENDLLEDEKDFLLEKYEEAETEE